MNIHIVEDDPVLARSLQINLELEGYRIFNSPSIQSAMELFKVQKFDFLILDLGLPDGSGFEILKQLRETQNQIPIIILSAQSDEDSVVKGLQMGANDFVKKPYSYKELHARMLVNFKKINPQQPQLSYFGLEVFSEQRLIKYNHIEIDMNRREFDILSFMIQRAEMIVSRETLIQLIGQESEIYDRTIDSHISHIRKTLKNHQVQNIKISSVYGLGYRLEVVHEK